MSKRNNNQKDKGKQSPNISNAIDSSINRNNSINSNNSKVIGKQMIGKIKDIPIYAALVIFLLTTLVFFWDVIFGSAYFWEDIVRFVYPLQNFAAKEAAKGSVPFWNPFSFSGMPFLADLQVGFFYPLNRILGLFIGADGSLSFSALQLMIILHFFISQINAYFLSKSMKISSSGSIIAAIGYSFSLLIAAHSIHPMIVQHLAWFPLVLMFFLKGVRFGDVKSGAIAGIIYGISMLSGHTQMALYEGLFLLIVWLWYFITNLIDKQSSGKSSFLSPVSALLTVAIAAGIFMIQYKPTQEMVKHSKRSDSSYEFVTQGSLEYKQLFTAFVPKLFGSVNGNNDMEVPYYLKGVGSHNYWETSFYFGIGILALGLFGFLSNAKRRDVQLMMILAIFGVLFSLGKNFFLFDIFYNLPFFGLFRNPARILFFTVLAFSYLAGIGFDTLYQRNWDSGISKRLYIAFGGVLLFALFGAFGVYSSMFATPEEFTSTINEYGWIAVLFSGLTGILAYIAARFKANSAAIAPVIIVIVFIDLYAAGADFNKTEADPMASYTELFSQNPELKKMLSPQYPSNIFRVKMRLYDEQGRTIAKPMEDNQGMIDNIMLFEGYNPLLLNRMIMPILPATTSLDLKNILFALEPDTASRQLIFKKRESAFGPAWFVYKTTVIPTEKLATASQKNDFSVMSATDFRNDVIIEKNNKIQLSGKPSSEVPHSVKITNYQNNAIAYEATSSENGMLCFSEMYYPEWKAYIDGKETEILAANYGLRAIEFPEGSHKIELRYESDAYTTGKAISFLSFLAGILIYASLFFTEKIRRKRGIDPESILE